MYNFGDVILAHVQYTDTFEIKIRPAFVLFEEEGNIVLMGITSNAKMKGISLSRKEGATKESVIKLNYIFTVSDKMVKKFLFSVSEEKKKIVREEFIKRLGNFSPI